LAVAAGPIVEQASDHLVISAAALIVPVQAPVPAAQPADFTRKASTALFWTGSISLSMATASASYWTPVVTHVALVVVVHGLGYAVPATPAAGAVATTSTPYSPIGPWMAGYVPDS